MSEILTTPRGRQIAFNRTEGAAPGVVFLGGLRSDKEGSKALHLEAWAQARGRAFLRFDYSGHGQSSGHFEEGCIGDWYADAVAALGALTEGPQVLVGSSMGGWIALLLAKRLPARVAALVGIAAAPDFTDAILAGLSEEERATLAAEGRIERPSEYAPEPYAFTRRLLEEGAAHRIFAGPLRLGMPVRLLQGTADTDVPPDTALRLLAHLEAEDARLTLVKGADHRFSSPACLDLLTETLDALG